MDFSAQNWKRISKLHYLVSKLHYTGILINEQCKLVLSLLKLKKNENFYQATSSYDGSNKFASRSVIIGHEIHIIVTD